MKRDEEIYFTNENGEKLKTSINSLTDSNGNTKNQIIFLDEKYKDYKIINYIDKGYLILLFDEMQYPVAFTNGGIKYIGIGGQLVDIEHPQSIGFKGKETFATSRGYIWSRTFPLLKDTIFIGHGPDSYALYFPQKDVVGKSIAYKQPNIVVDKPHNWYLQIAVNTGILSLLAIIILLLLFSWNSIKIFKLNKEKNDESIIGVCILVSIIGYCIAGIFNDSVVSVAPIFWIILGMGIKTQNDMVKPLQ